MLIPIKVGYLPKMALDSELRKPPIINSLPLMHGPIEGVGDYLIVIREELCTKIGMLITLHSTKCGVSCPYACLLIWLPDTYSEIK